jgi:hypothetical protein
VEPFALVTLLAISQECLEEAFFCRHSGFNCLPTAATSALGLLLARKTKVALV